jgi:hypothetical protein
MNNPQNQICQLEFISPRNVPHSNPASYDPRPPAEELKPPVPTVILGPNAVYLVEPGYWLEKMDPGVGIQPPVLSSVEPNELPVWAQDTEVFWNGDNFTENSVIMWNDGEEATKFISAEKLSTIVKPSTVQAPLPYTLETYVVDQGKETSKLTFTFIT